MSEQYSQFSESSKINQQFRKEIRRKDIDRRLAERRKMLMQMEKHSYQEQESINESNFLSNKLKSIYQGWNCNGGKLGVGDLKELAKISCEMAGLKVMVNFPK